MMEAKQEETGSSESKGFSFGFSKKITSRKLQASSINEEKDDSKTDQDFVTSVDGKEVKSVKVKEEEKELVIPCIVKNTWRKTEEDKYKKSTNVPKEAEGDLDSQAISELVEDARRQQDEWEEVGKSVESDRVVPILVQNKLPEGYETDDKLDVSLRPDEAHAADYDQVPIEEYGLAMLRGMGWKLGQGVGRNKEACKPVDAILRPKGLGLGADKSQNLQLNYSKSTSSSKTEKNKDELILKKDTCCKILSGVHKHLYGKIEGLDDDNARVLVKLTIGGQTVSLSQYNIQLVNNEEYNKYSKYLNKGKVDKFKEDEERKTHKSERRQKDKDQHRDENRHSDSDSKRSHDKRSQDHSEERSKDRSHDKRSRDKSEDESSEHLREEPHRKHKKRSNRESKPSKSISDTNGESGGLWVRPEIRVRIIDKHLKKGRFYNAKVVVIDVIEKDNCVVQTEDGSVLEGISQKYLETVVPKSDPAYAVVVRGKYQGQIVQIMDRNKKLCNVTAQLLEDRDTAVELDYDNICEYTGNIDEEFHF